MAASRATLRLDRALLRAGERLCVAISGGADSTALLLSLVEANTAPPPSRHALKSAPIGLVLSAAHVHHGLRGADADADEAFVRELCARLEVPLRVFHVDTAARQTEDGEGLEEAARVLRYKALCGLITEGAADVFATAHTLDDQAETVMMKLLRGAWTEGLGAISPVVEGAGKVIRPMLGVRRSEVEAYLREREQPWREDKSNTDLSLTRNRVRHQLMPALRDFNPAVDELLSRMAEIARDEEAFWQAEVARVLLQVVLPGKPVRGGGRAVSTASGEQGCAVEIARLAAMPAALRRRVVRAVARQMGVRLGAEETARVLALAGFGGIAEITGRPGSRLELRHGLRVERSVRELQFWRSS